jgi:hypothetical protein
MSEPWILIRWLWTRVFQGRAEAFDAEVFDPEAFEKGVVVAVAREAHALRNAPREVLDMHDRHDVQMAHRDRLDAEGQSVELYASRPS